MQPIEAPSHKLLPAYACPNFQERFLLDNSQGPATASRSAAGLKAFFDRNSKSNILRWALSNEASGKETDRTENGSPMLLFIPTSPCLPSTSRWMTIQIKAPPPGEDRLRQAISAQSWTLRALSLQHQNRKARKKKNKGGGRYFLKNVFRIVRLKE